MSKKYRIRPSEIMEIEDAYTSYCFDEACVYILSKMENNEKPHFVKINKDENGQPTSYSKPSDMYKAMGYDSGSYVKVVE